MRFLTVFFILFFLFSCKKSSPKPKVGISATIAGVTQNFNTEAGAMSEFYQLYALSVKGQNCGCIGGSIIAITISSPTPITAGTYIASAFNALGTNTNITFSSPLATYFYDDHVSASNATVIIKSISATNVQGTFSGTLAYYTGSREAPATQAITNGEFNLNIIPGQ